MSSKTTRIAYALLGVIACAWVTIAISVSLNELTELRPVAQAAIVALVALVFAVPALSAIVAGRNVQIASCVVLGGISLVLGGVVSIANLLDPIVTGVAMVPAALYLTAAVLRTK